MAIGQGQGAVAGSAAASAGSSKTIFSPDELAGLQLDAFQGLLIGSVEVQLLFMTFVATGAWILLALNLAARGDAA